MRRLRHPLGNAPKCYCAERGLDTTPRLTGTATRSAFAPFKETTR